LARGLRATDAVPAGAFALELLASGHGLPDWVRPLPYRLPESDQFKNQFALVLEIVPAQGPADAAVRRARFLAAMGDPAAARELVRQVLGEDPRHIPGLVLLAQLQRAARDRPAHGATIQRLLPLLATGPALEPDDRVALALELAAANALDAARAQVALGWATSRSARCGACHRSCWRSGCDSRVIFSVSAPAGLLAAAEHQAAADRLARP